MAVGALAKFSGLEVSPLTTKQPLSFAKVMSMLSMLVAKCKLRKGLPSFTALIISLSKNAESPPGDLVAAGRKYFSPSNRKCEAEVKQDRFILSNRKVKKSSYQFHFLSLKIHLGFNLFDSSSPTCVQRPGSPILEQTARVYCDRYIRGDIQI